MARKGDASSRAVMSRRRAKDDESGLLSDEERLWNQLDLYCSPPWAARAGAEIAQKLWPAATIVREPAAGMLSMAGPISDYFGAVICTDVHAHVPGVEVRDFLDDAHWPEEPDCDLIMTNPPFKVASEFLQAALRRARLGVALLVRTVWVESADRYPLFVGENPCTQIAFFSERVPMALGPWDPDVGSATSYSWMFWSKVHDPLPPIWIPPGTRDRLWRKDDPAKYGRLYPMPLFEERTVADAIGDVV